MRSTQCTRREVAVLFRVKHYGHSDGEDIIVEGVRRQWFKVLGPTKDSTRKTNSTASSSFLSAKKYFRGFGLAHALTPYDTAVL